jgi:hypothetical protein
MGLGFRICFISLFFFTSFQNLYLWKCLGFRFQGLTMIMIGKYDSPRGWVWYVLFSAAMNKLLGGSAKTGGYSEVARSAVEPLGNKLSTPNLRKRRLNPEESRVPLSALHASQQEEPETDFTDLAPGSPVKISAKEGIAVYTKRPKTGTTPPTPPLRSLSRRRVVVAPPSPSPAPPPVFESRSEKVSSPEASMPVVEQAAELDNLQPVRRQLISPPITEER